MNTQNSRSKEILDKVYDHLGSIDLDKLSWSEKKDFVEVVQKCRFLETTGQIPTFGFGGFTPPIHPEGPTGPVGPKGDIGPRGIV